MTYAAPPDPLEALGATVVPIIRRAYDINAGRHDELVGDDAMTFGFGVYRNSWFLVEEGLRDVDGWQTARPDGSLLISGHGYRLHLYRLGHDERVDLDSFRLDDADGSKTKQSIPQINGQLTMAFNESARGATAAAEPDLRDLVIVHAGNADDGCCGMWVGAPVASDHVVVSPWAWVTPFWIIERPEQLAEMETDLGAVARHDELPEPNVEVTPVDDEDSSAGEA
jgi:hypothetical protein